MIGCPSDRECTEKVDSQRDMKRLRNRRLADIQQKLVREGTSTIDDLARCFDVSTATIRRDLKSLEGERRIVQTINGGVMYRLVGGDIGHDRNPEMTHIEQKIRIGEYCVGLVDQHDEIIVGPGTTPLVTARILSGIQEIQFRLLTNSLELARDLAPVANIRTVVLGGELIKDSCTTGYSTHEDFFGSCHKKHTLFMTADGIDVTNGITLFSSEFVQLIRKMIRVSSSIYLLCDSTKLQKVSFNFVADLSIVTAVITDTGASEDFSRGCAERGVQVVLV